MAGRHFAIASLQGGESEFNEDFLLPRGLSALQNGRFNQAISDFECLDGPSFHQHRLPLLSLVALRLGQSSQAAEWSHHVAPSAFQGDLLLLILWACVRRELAEIEGTDPAAPLDQAIAAMKDAGMGGVVIEAISWQVALHRSPCEAQITMGTSLLDALRSYGDMGARHMPPVLLEVAEVHHQAGHAEARSLALEAARMLRRGITPYYRYLPDSLVRCAKVLEATDPAEAAALMHVARRWVLQALPHVPESARESFTSEVAVNRMLLSESG
jgi:hypothetical protein